MMPGQIRMFHGQTLILLLCGLTWISCNVANGATSKEIAPPGVTLDICSGSVFHAECGDEGVVVMETAVYGRKRTESKCVVSRGQLCSKDVLPAMEGLCSGRHRCEVVIPHVLLDQAVPCDRELRSYLEATYSCVAAEIPHQSNCQPPMKIPVYSRQVNITSLSSDEMGCRKDAVTYILEGQQGQTLNISLMDFGSEQDHTMNCGKDFQYGSLLDTSKNGHQVAICGGKERVRRIYSSEGNQLKLRLPQMKNRKYHFIVGVTAVGCPDLVAQKHAWVRRDDREAVIGCHETRQTWHLECQGHRWRGVIGNCTRYLEAAKMAANKLRSESSLPHGMAIMIIIGIAFLLSLLIIGVGLVFLRWYKLKNKSAHYTYDYGQHDRQIYEEPKYKLREPVPEPSGGQTGGALRKNEYTHIWEHPLPEPCLAHGNQAPGGYGMPARGDMGTSPPVKEQYGGSLDSKGVDGLRRYYALDRDPQTEHQVFTTSLVT